MNKNYRLIFNKVLGVMQVVSELAKASGKKSSGKSRAMTRLNKSLPFKPKASYTLPISAAVTFMMLGSTLALAQSNGGGSGGAGGYMNSSDWTAGSDGLGGVGGSGGHGGSYGGLGGGGTGSAGGGIGLAGGANNSSVVTGGAGSVGAPGAGLYGPGGGGGGGGVGLLISTDSNFSNSGSFIGGAGGAGGASNFASFTGGGGSGGSGMAGSDFTFSNTGIIQGGVGGVGSGAINGIATAPSGSGGAGISIFGVGSANITNSNIIAGGIGGSGFNSGSDRSQGANGGNAIDVNGSVTTTIANSGSITGSAGGAGFSASAGGGVGGTGGTGVSLSGAGASVITNSGSITGGNGGAAYFQGGAGAGIAITGNGPANISNRGRITGGNGYSGAGGISIGSGAGGSVTVVNQGTISSGTSTRQQPATNIVNNSTTLTSFALSNAQTALSFSGTLPTSYSIIINSPTSYGQLAVTGGTGNTTFGISSLSAGKSAVSSSPYSAILSGISPSQLGISGTSLSGRSNDFSYTLTETDTVNYIWSLLVSSYYSTADTQQSLVNTAQVLQGTFTLQNSVLSNSFSYDCNTFGSNDVCISVGGRNTTVQAANGLNNNSALIIAAYRPHPNYRIGAYADQNLSVSNPGGNVNLGNNTPLFGLFGAWNERLDGIGTEIKVSAAYGQKNATVTRSVVGTSEAGSGSSSLVSQGAQVVAKYGFAVMPEVILSPYLGMRYTSSNMGGYTEGTSSSVAAPLTYNALNTNATTALAGVGASYKLDPLITTFASAGVETDTNTANGSYYGTNSKIVGLTPVNFNPNPVKTRPTATVGAYYDIEKNQRVGITGIYRQEPYQAVSTTTVLVTYAVGL